MRTSWKLGQFAGIDCYVHPTLFLVLAYVLAFNGGILSMALVGAAFGCVLLHELGHSLMARRFGIETEDITLYPIGGIARLRRLPKAPGVELAIAVAGPAVNVAIAVVLGLFLFATPLLDGSELLRVFALNLMVVNGLLAAFNMIPAFPMDGGRVLRAVLSGWFGRQRATSIAANLGRLLAVLYGTYNLVLFLTGSSDSSLMQILLATFIYFAAGNELRSVEAEERGGRGQGGGGELTTPPGFRWVSRGNGLWQLAPIIVESGPGRRPSSPWS